MKITMVKKQLRDGSTCRKCEQAESLLRQRGLWSRIAEVVWAIEGDAESPGMRLAFEHGVDLAPFFLVEESGQTAVHTSVLKLIQEKLTNAPPLPNEAAGEALSELQARLSSAAPADILRYALQRYGSRCAIAFSGAEDVVLIELAHRLGLPYSVFCLDTGRLHPQTYRFLERVREHYAVQIEVFFPNFVAVQELVRNKGLLSFYADGHEECCSIRKVEPLGRALSPYHAWVTGQRRDQSPSTRAELEVVSLDSAHHNEDGNPLLKFNPLAHWSLAEVWAFIRENGVPYNELHDEGFVSIGCEPCTRALRPGEHERAARWWWEEGTQRECGLHLTPKARA